MNARAKDAGESVKPPRNKEDFSLAAGGPLFQLLLRVSGSDARLMRLRQGMVVLVPLLAWLPLLVLSASAGQLYGGSPAVPFLLDFEVHIRFLLALPLLLIAELVTEQRMRPLRQHFLERNLIPQDTMSRFEAVVASAFRLRNSVVAEVLVIAFVYGIGVMIVWRQHVAPDIATWYATSSAEGSRLSRAGMWYGYVSLPIFQFLLCRWYFRLFIWARFLWQVSRIKLNLMPTHPDRVGGLSFISHSLNGLVVLAAAHGALLAAYLSTRVVLLGVSLTQFKTEVVVMVIFVLFVTLGPFLVFAPQFWKVKRKGLQEYGMLATRYVGQFDAKWLRRGAPIDEPLMGSPDIQSLADLGNSYNMVQSMRKVPVTKEDVIRFVVVTLVPVGPLLLTMMPMEEMVKKLVSMLL
jgi:hypothetical protein